MIMSQTPIDPDLEPSLGVSLPWYHLSLVFLGGALGTLARYAAIRGWIVSHNDIPWPLLSINASGSFVLGVLTTRIFQKQSELVGLRLFLSTGFLGGWTTYSSCAATVLLLGHSQAWFPIAVLLVFTIGINPLLALVGRKLGSTP